MLRIDLGGCGPSDLAAFRRADVIAGGHVELQPEHPRPLDRVEGQHIERKLLRGHLGLHQGVDEYPRLDFFNVQHQLERHGDVTVGEGPVGPRQRPGQIGGIALIPQVVDAVSIPVLAAGSLVDGRGLAAALAFGAQGVWMGTRFIASHEANASEDYKKRIGEIAAPDTAVTRAYSGKPMRVIRNQFVSDWERHPEDIAPFPEQMRRSLEEGVLLLGHRGDLDTSRTCMPCGQGAGAIHEIVSCREIIDNVMREAKDTIERLGALA